MDTTTEPMPLLDGHRARQKLFRFDSTVSMGTLLQMALLASGMLAAWGAYTADQAKSKMEVDQIKVDAVAQRTAMKESLGELRGDVKDMQRTLADVNQSMAVLKARSEPQTPRRP